MELKIFHMLGFFKFSCVLVGYGFSPCTMNPSMIHKTTFWGVNVILYLCR